jgi:hypothetical protein
MQTENKEQIYLIPATVESIHFTCRTCGTPLAMSHEEGSCTTNMFCFCTRQYWVDWQAGILHMGLDDNQLAERVARELRNNGVGRLIS